jgi:hypothetical protein
VVERLAPVPALDGDRAQVKEGKRIRWPVFQIETEQPDIALELPGPQCLVELAGRSDGQGSPLHAHTRFSRGRQALLMNSIAPVNVGAQRKQSDMTDDGLTAGPSGLGSPHARQQSHQLLAFIRLDDIIRIQPERINSRGMR